MWCLPQVLASLGLRSDGLCRTIGLGRLGGFDRPRRMAEGQEAGRARRLAANDQLRDESRMGSNVRYLRQVGS